MASSGTMIDHGDNTVHFTKLKASQLAEVRSVLKKRPQEKFSVGLSPEAQEAMQQVQEDTKIQEAARRGKRGSKGNVEFSDKVHIRQEVPSPFPGRRPSFADMYSHARLENADRRMPALPDVRGVQRGSTSGAEPGSPRRNYGRRPSLVSRGVSERRGSVTRGVSETDEVDQVSSANLAPGLGET